jgi:two-component system OmpR family sensor kinase
MRAPASLRVRVALAAGAAIALATVALGITAVALSEREQASSRDAALRAGATQVAQLSVSAPALLTAPGALEGRVGGRRLLVEVLDRRGRIVARSASLGGDVLGTRAQIARVIASGRAAYSDATLGGQSLRLYRAGSRSS